jgi:hypothetical protein
MTISKHFQTERADRYAYIATTVGVGTVVHTVTQQWTKHKSGIPCKVNITNTGVAIITDQEGNLVTMYILTIEEAKRYFVNAAIPMVLAAIIKMNTKRRHHILQNEVKF